MDPPDLITGRVTLRINGRPVDVEMTVPARPVKLHRMLPVFHQITDLFVDASVEAAKAEGRTVSCQAGCGACCRQAVPLSEAEVHQIAELVQAIPEPRRSEIRARFAAGVARVRASGWFEAIDACVQAAQSAPPEAARQQLVQVVLQYFDQGVACPFLEAESCSIHEVRPLACREYLVTSPPVHCATPGTGAVGKVDMFLKPSRSLWNISSADGKPRILPLILALELAANDARELPEKTGSEWAMAFFNDVAHASGRPP